MYRELWKNKDGTIDIESLDIYVGNGWALQYEWRLWLMYNRWFNVLKPKKALPFKK